VEVFPDLLGSRLARAAGSALAGQINQFFDDILTSPLIDQLAEYSVPGLSIGHGKRTGSLTITAPALTSSVARHRHPAHAAAGNRREPGGSPPSPNALYFIYLPLGVKVVQGGSASCQGFCGYHNDISGQTSTR